MNVSTRCLPAILALLLGCTSPEPPAENSQQPAPSSETTILPMVVESPAIVDDSVRRFAEDERPTELPASAKKDSESSERDSPPTPTLDELLLFFPSKHPHGEWQPNGLTFEDVWFTADDGTRIHGWYCPCDMPRAVLLYAHGNAGNLSHRASLLARLQSQLRVSVLIFDYRGFGRSEGIPSVDGILRDARAARTFLAKRAAVDESELVLMGRSLGGSVAIQLAAESPPRALILQSTFSSLQDVASIHYPKLAWLVPPNKLDSAAQIASYEGPLLQSHGDADRTIPYSLGEKLFRAANEPKRFVAIPHGDHNDPQSGEYNKELDRFLDALADD